MFCDMLTTASVPVCYTRSAFAAVLCARQAGALHYGHLHKRKVGVDVIQLVRESFTV